MSLETANETDLRTLAQAFAREMSALETSVKGAAKAAKDLVKAAEAQDAARAVTILQKFEKLQLPLVDVKKFIGDVRRHLEEEDRRLKFYLGKQLRDAAQAAGVDFSVLTTDPPEFRLGQMTAAVDLPRRTASIRYARLELEQVPSAPGAIVEAARKTQAGLEGTSFDPDRYFDQLLEAYRIKLQRLGQPFGNRVDLVDLLAEVAFIRQGERFLEDPRKENFQPYSRVQLAYDLARLRRAGRLARHGFRLALGSATGGSTKQKVRVLYLEDDRGAGQYYLSIWFTREGT